MRPNPFLAGLFACAVTFFCGFLAPVSALRPPDTSLSAEERAKASALLKEYKAATDYDKRMETLKELVELDLKVAKVMWDMIERDWHQSWPRYQEVFRKQAKVVAKKKDTPDKRKRIEELSATVRSLRSAGNLSKEMIKQKGDPAVAELKKLRGVSPQEVAESSEQMQAAHDRIFALAREYNYCVDEMLLTDFIPIDEKGTLVGFENSACSQALPADKQALSILVENEKLAEKVLPEEAEGIRDVNALRMLIGLKPVLLDPKLCEASRDHSKDMKEKGFFAHDSPVKGKETPWKRAKNFGTSAGAENIFAGSTSPYAANKAWWYSPGHHKNMLAPGHKRGAMGHFEGRWTQMFGG